MEEPWVAVAGALFGWLSADGLRRLHRLRRRLRPRVPRALFLELRIRGGLWPGDGRGGTAAPPGPDEGDAENGQDGRAVRDAPGRR